MSKSCDVPIYALPDLYCLWQKLHLFDGVTAPYLKPSLILQNELELVFVKNNHAFVDEYLKKPEFVDLMRRLGALGDGNSDQGKVFAWRAYTKITSKLLIKHYAL